MGDTPKLMVYNGTSLFWETSTCTVIRGKTISSYDHWVSLRQHVELQASAPQGTPTIYLVIYGCFGCSWRCSYCCCWLYIPTPRTPGWLSHGFYHLNLQWSLVRFPWEKTVWICIPVSNVRKFYTYIIYICIPCIYIYHIYICIYHII